MRGKDIKFIHIISIMTVVNSNDINLKNPNESLEISNSNLQIALSIMHSVSRQRQNLQAIVPLEF